MFNAINCVVISTTVISYERITVVALVNGEKIAELRQQRGWGQRDLATIAEVDPSVISRLERNLQDDCMLSVVVALAATLGVTIDELLAQGQQTNFTRLVPELQSEVNQLAQKPIEIQRQAAGILHGYLSTLGKASG